MEPPVLAGDVGQASVTTMAGDIVTLQVVETLFVVELSVQTSRPVPRKVVVTEQELAGTV
jgi:hypothetical protein